MNDRATALTVFAMVIAAVVAIIVGLSWLTYRHDERMAELGYQEEMVPGSSCPYWRKCK